MTVVRCTACGAQYPWQPQLAGQKVRCAKCNAVFAYAQLEPTVGPVRNPPTPPVAPSAPWATMPASARAASSRPSNPYAAGGAADAIDYELFGEEMQYVEITLDPGEMVVAEAGAMMYMTGGIKMETVFGDPSATQQQGGFWNSLMSAGKRVLTGESLFMTTFAAVSHQREKVAFASPYPGKILPMHLDQLGGELICQKSAFLCGARGVQVSIHFQKKILAGLFGGEGFVMQRLAGDGIVMIHAGGTLMHRELAPGETLRLDTGCLVALTPDVHYDVEMIGGIRNTFFGGEGLFLATVRGPGQVWLQSLPFTRLAGRVLANAGGGASKDEGTVLNNLGGLGSFFMGDE